MVDLVIFPQPAIELEVIEDTDALMHLLHDSFVELCLLYVSSANLHEYAQLPETLIAVDYNTYIDNPEMYHLIFAIYISYSNIIIQNPSLCLNMLADIGKLSIIMLHNISSVDMSTDNLLNSTIFGFVDMYYQTEKQKLTCLLPYINKAQKIHFSGLTDATAIEFLNLYNVTYNTSYTFDVPIMSILYNDTDFLPLDPSTKFFPPVGSLANMHALRQLVLDNKIFALASYHSQVQPILQALPYGTALPGYAFYRHQPNFINMLNLLFGNSLVQRLLYTNPLTLLQP